MKGKFFNLLRPFYLPLVRALRSRLVTEQAFVRHPDMSIPTPWDFVQFQAERNLHGYLHVLPEHIREVVVVGAYDGEEAMRMKGLYRNARFTMFEPSPLNFPVLQKRFSGVERVRCIPKACGRQPGEMPFYELPMQGNGSLLKPQAEDWSRFTRSKVATVTEHKVQVTTVDIEMHETQPVDLLWIDVQGAELDVMGGAQSTLSRTNAVFLEVALAKSAYSGGALIDQLAKFLQAYGFEMVLLGCDPWSFGGNALWVKDPGSLIAQEPQSPDDN